VVKKQSLKPFNQQVKKNNKNNLKKPCENKKEYYFCTRIKADVLLENDNYPKKKTFKKSQKNIWIIKSKVSIFADPKRENWGVQVLKNSG